MKIIILTISLFLSNVFGSLLESKTKGDFHLTCDNISVTGTSLTATCDFSGSPSYVPSELDIDSIFKIFSKEDAENLGVDNSKTAEGCKLVQGTTELDCAKSTCLKNKSYKVNLNNLVANIDGKLTAQTGGNFAQTCRNVKFVAGKLSAECLTQVKTQQKTSSLNLNNCIKNANGLLKWAVGGNYNASCKECRNFTTSRGQAPVFSCKCNDGGWFGGAFKDTQINLSIGITNTNGVLVCDNRNERKRKLK